MIKLEDLVRLREEEINSENKAKKAYWWKNFINRFGAVGGGILAAIFGGGIGFGVGLAVGIIIAIVSCVRGEGDYNWTWLLITGSTLGVIIGFLRTFYVIRKDFKDANKKR